MSNPLIEVVAAVELLTGPDAGVYQGSPFFHPKNRLFTLKRLFVEPKTGEVWAKCYPITYSDNPEDIKLVESQTYSLLLRSFTTRYIGTPGSVLFEPIDAVVLPYELLLREVKLRITNPTPPEEVFAELFS